MQWCQVELNLREVYTCLIIFKAKVKFRGNIYEELYKLEENWMSLGQSVFDIRSHLLEHVQ